jgi:hypothetical protein
MANEYKSVLLYLNSNLAMTTVYKLDFRDRLNKASTNKQTRCENVAESDIHYNDSLR